MFKLSAEPSKEEYKANAGTEVLLGDKVVTVVLDRVDTKSGSWERGFKFGSITYGILKKLLAPRGSKKFPYRPARYSCDHGKTWHEDIKAAKKSKGKVIVERPPLRGEFAFEGIQKINREYYGSDYRWKA